jgi:hypothetical protein
MPHIAEGDLHAWLDGALPEGSEEWQSIQHHIDSCPDCAVRLQEARDLRDDARDVLSSALPEASAPSFEDIRQRAQGGAPGRVGVGPGSGRMRRGWLSAQRLGWAATVMLALGAGWIGRAVLVEKGWTDPFNEGQSPTASQVADAAADPAREFFRNDAAELEEESDEVGQRKDQLAEANEALLKREAAAGGEGIASSELNAQKERTFGDTPTDADDEAEGEAATPRRIGALAQAEAPEAEDLLAVDGVMAPAAEAVGQEARSKAMQPPPDPWHAIPAVRLGRAVRDAPGCYRLEYSWSPGVEYLPGTIELTGIEPEGRTGQSTYAITIPGGPASELHEAIWVSPHPDSVWVRLVSGLEREAFTVRAGRSGVDWLGEGRVLIPATPVSAGQTRGTVRLVRIGCEPT